MGTESREHVNEGEGVGRTIRTDQSCCRLKGSRACEHTRDLF